MTLHGTLHAFCTPLSCLHSQLEPSQLHSNSTDLKDYCTEIEKKIEEFKEASEKLARLDQQRTTGAAVTMSERVVSYMSRLRAVRSEIRKTRGNMNPTLSTTGFALSSQSTNRLSCGKNKSYGVNIETQL